jgi:Flp pilus assembly protein TadG
MTSEFSHHGALTDQAKRRFGLVLRSLSRLAKRGQKLECPNSVCRNNNRRGAAVVEFAVVAPLLLLLVLGTIEYGRFVMVQQILTNAVREGARQASLDSATQAEVIQVVANYCTDAGIPVDDTTVNPDPTAVAPGAPITVTVQTAFDQVSWFPTPIYLVGATVSATSTMRRATR